MLPCGRLRSCSACGEAESTHSVGVRVVVGDGRRRESVVGRRSGSRRRRRRAAKRSPGIAAAGAKPPGPDGRSRRGTRPASDGARGANGLPAGSATPPAVADGRLPALPHSATCTRPRRRQATRMRRHGEPRARGARHRVRRVSGRRRAHPRASGRPGRRGTPGEPRQTGKSRQPAHRRAGCANGSTASVDRVRRRPTMQHVDRGGRDRSVTPVRRDRRRAARGPRERAGRCRPPGRPWPGDRARPLSRPGPTAAMPAAASDDRRGHAGDASSSRSRTAAATGCVIDSATGSGVRRDGPDDAVDLASPSWSRGPRRREGSAPEAADGAGSAAEAGEPPKKRPRRAMPAPAIREPTSERAGVRSGTLLGASTRPSRSPPGSLVGRGLYSPFYPTGSASVRNGFDTGAGTATRLVRVAAISHHHHGPDGHRRTRPERRGVAEAGGDRDAADPGAERHSRG